MTGSLTSTKARQAREHEPERPATEAEGFSLTPAAPDESTRPASRQTQLAWVRSMLAWMRKRKGGGGK